MQVLQAGFGGSFASLYGQQLPLTLGLPLDGCNALSSARQGGSLLLLQAGTAQQPSR